MKVLKQRNIGRWWGYFMQIIQQEAIVIQAIMMILQLITTATVLQIAGYQIPIWLLTVIVASMLIVGGLGVWIIGMPSYFSAFNDQFYKHDNPLRKDVEKIAEQQKKIMKHLGIEDED